METPTRPTVPQNSLPEEVHRLQAKRKSRGFPLKGSGGGRAGRGGGAAPPEVSSLTCQVVGNPGCGFGRQGGGLLEEGQLLHWGLLMVSRESSRFFGGQ